MSGCWSARCALAVLAAAGCSHGPRPIAMTLGPSHQLLIPADVNGHACVLQLDTGASTTSFRRGAVQAFHLRGGTPTAGHGAGGALARAYWMIVNKLEFAGERVRGAMVTLIDLDTAGGAIDGVLGMDLLGDYAVEVDLAARQLTLHRSIDGVAHLDALAAIDYRRLPGGQIALAVTANGRPATAVLDLGANRTFANHAAITADDEWLTVSAAIGVDRHLLTFQTASDVHLALAGLVLPTTTAWINDLPIFATFGLADQPAIVLGTDALADRRIVIDPFHHRVYVSPAQ